MTVPLTELSLSPEDVGVEARDDSSPEVRQLLPGEDRPPGRGQDGEPDLPLHPGEEGLGAHS